MREEERACVLKPEHERRTGREANKHLPVLWRAQGRALGVYLKFWGDGEPGTQLTCAHWFPISGGVVRKIEVMLVNDDKETISGKPVLSQETLDGKVLAPAGKLFRLDAVRKNTYELSLPGPKECGRHLLNATVHPESARHMGSTVSRRKIAIGKWR